MNIYNTLNNNYIYKIKYGITNTYSTKITTMKPAEEFTRNV